MTGWRTEDVVPHRGAMSLLDGVESFDAESRTLVARVAVRPGCTFDDGAGVGSWAAVEYMAQAAAALSGCRDRAADPSAAPRPGFLLGTRRLALGLDRFERGRVYRVTARCEYEDGDAAAFACSIRDDSGRVVASATLNAYRPQADEVKRLKS